MMTLTRQNWTCPPAFQLAPPLKEFGTITHREPMLSLANAMNKEELSLFYNRLNRG